VTAYRIYFDACALNRLSDDASQARVLAEAQAVESILSFVFAAQVEWVGSRALEVELTQNPDASKLEDSLELLAHARPLEVADESIRRRAITLGLLGYGAFDALHLAHAESARVDGLLTTDDRFIGKAGRGLGNPLVRVVNPIDWLQEVRQWLRVK